MCMCFSEDKNSDHFDKITATSYLETFVSLGCYRTFFKLLT